MDSQSKKKKNTENRNRTHHVAGACKNPITSLAWQRSNPITQYKSKPKSELSKLSTLTQRTEHRGVYQKKKKKSPIHKPKPNPVTHGVHRRHRHYSELHVVVVATEGLIADRHRIDIVDAVDRSVVCHLCLCHCAGELWAVLVSRQPASFAIASSASNSPASLKIFLSKTLTLSLSLLFSLYLTEWIMNMLISPASLSIIFFFFFNVEVWVSECVRIWLGGLANFNSFFFFLIWLSSECVTRLHS